jgi:hypothetical protein
MHFTCFRAFVLVIAISSESFLADAFVLRVRQRHVRSISSGSDKLPTLCGMAHSMSHVRRAPLARFSDEKHGAGTVSTQTIVRKARRGDRHVQSQLGHTVVHHPSHHKELDRLNARIMQRRAPHGPSPEPERKHPPTLRTDLPPL